MVMVIFKPLGAHKADIVATKCDNIEKYGRDLFLEYANVREQLFIKVSDLSDVDVCDMALGAMLADYRFDKYDSLKSDDYPILEVITFLSNDYMKIQQNFETYMSMANAIRFAKDLYNEPKGKYQTEQYFFEIKRLEYLGLGFKDCGDNLLRLVWRGTDDKLEKVIVSKNRQVSAVGAGVMKVVALQQLPINLVAYLKIEGEINDLVVKNPIYIRDNLNSETMVEQELRQVYMQVIGDENEKR